MNSKKIKTAGIYLAILFSVVAVFSFTFAKSQKNYQESQNHAIVFEPTMVKSSPSFDGNNLFEINEGLKVQIIDTLDSWAHIRIADGKQGWVIDDNIKRF